MSDSARGRRRFLGDLLTLTAASTLPWHRLQAADAAPMRRKSILILGGTGFIGPHLVKHAVDRGHTVSIFTRGRREADLPPTVERLVGDRNGKLEALTGRKWDAVIDDSATNPDWVRQSTELLAANTAQYLFTSSTGVYYPYLKKGLNEADPVHTDAKDPKDGSESFGTRKAQCEALVRASFGTRSIVVRPTYIVGPGDYTDRFTYWPVRLDLGGDVLAPGRPTDRVQFIDVRDLAAFMLRLVEADASGIFNAIGPRQPMTVKAFLDQAIAAVRSSARLTWVDDYDLLAKNEIDGIVPWILARGNDLGHTTVETTKSFKAGLTYRDTADTVRDTLAWFKSLPADRQAAARWVLTTEKERALLLAWRTAHPPKNN